MKIKSRKKLEEEYNKKYGDVSLDVYERLKDKLGEDFNEDLLQSALNRINESKKKLKHHMIKMTFYEEPKQTHRPRVNYGTKIMYVPNAKANAKSVANFINDLKEDIDVICTPIKIELTAYLPMPTMAKPLDILLYELEFDYAIGKPDFDNILKAYCDMIQNSLILDDDIVASATFNKFYSLKPRVELNIIYANGYASEYAFNRIVSRKSYKDLNNKTDIRLLVEPYKKKPKKKKKKE